MAVFLALVAWFCSGFVLLVALVWGLGLKCDDSCSPGRGWRYDPDAWQWNGIAALGVLAFIAGAALVIFVWLRKPALATVAVAVGFGCAYVLFGGLSSEWVDHLDRRSGGELLLMTSAIFAPVLAVLLTVGSGNAREPV